MALQGTMKDFGLPDIFQLIGIQKKTGILTLQNGEDTVTVKFLEGQVVGADTHTKTLEDRLGEVLVRTGRITGAQLQEALRVQKNTLQRLGYILVSSKHISEDELVEALRVQSTQIIYRLFRWQEGEYHFDPVEDLEYDQRHFTPISSETILMEGARMIDEWPIIERRVNSPALVFRKTESAEALDLNVDSIIDEDIDFDLGFDRDGKPGEEGADESEDQGLKLSADERRLLALVDGKRSVQDVCDLLIMGEFDTYRMLSDLVTRNLVEAVPRKRERPDTPETRLLGTLLVRVCQAALVLSVMATLVSLRVNPFTPWRFLAQEPATNHARHYASLARMENIEQAVQVFYLDAGTLPRSLSVLAQNGYLEPTDLVDPWGRPYHLQISPGGYQLAAVDADGRPIAGMIVSHSFSSAQRLMLVGDAETLPGSN